MDKDRLIVKSLDIVVQIDKVPNGKP